MAGRHSSRLESEIIEAALIQFDEDNISEKFVKPLSAYVSFAARGLQA